MVAASLASWLRPAARPAVHARAAAADSVTVSTFNLWCPAYRRLDGDESVRESAYPEVYEQRQAEILELPVWETSDIVCCQEFWYGCPDILDKYIAALSPRFRLHGLQRSGERPDGLFMAIAQEWRVVHEADLDFEDTAGRCAQLLHLRRAPSLPADADDADADADPSGGGAAVDELIVANVHLLFPHNEALESVRVREVYKLLAYLDQYKASLAAPPPALICGDLNGATGGVVAQSLARHGWRDSFSEFAGCDVHSGESCGWVSHRNHLGQAEGVDYVLVQSPSVPRIPVADWTDFVMAEIAQALLDRGHGEPASAWRVFTELSCADDGAIADAAGADAAGADAASADAPDAPGVAGADAADADAEALRCCVDADGFRVALQQLGFGRAPLTPREVEMLVASCDADNNGAVDGTEWRNRFASALRRLQSEELIVDQQDTRQDLVVCSSQIWPRCLEKGQWPADAHWSLSDHGVVTSTFERVVAD